MRAKRPGSPRELFSLGVPILGICYGEQLICDLLGGNVTPGDHREFGRAEVEIVADSALFSGIWSSHQTYQVWMSHGDKVNRLPPGFKVTARTETAPYAAIADEARRIYGVQFHPEVAHTPDGAKLIANFRARHLRRARRLEHARLPQRGDRQDPRAGRRQQGHLRRLGRGRFLGRGQAAARGAGRPAGLHLRRYRHAAAERGAGGAQALRRILPHPRWTHVDASQIFLQRLHGITDPERKRKIIGETFIEVFEREAERIGGAEFLAQGTLYPDVIESISFHGGRRPPSSRTITSAACPSA